MDPKHSKGGHPITKVVLALAAVVIGGIAYRNRKSLLDLSRSLRNH